MSDEDNSDDDNYDEDNYYNFGVFNNGVDVDDDDVDDDDVDVDDDDDDVDDDDGVRINGHRVEDLEDIKEYERGLMIAERQVDDHVARLGCTVFKRKGYDSLTESESWTVRILLEEEENNNEATDEKNNNEASAYDKLMDEIENYRYFLEVLERDMKEIREKYTGEIDAIKEEIKEKLKRFRENACRVHNQTVSGPGNDGAKCLQDIAAMGMKISPLKSTMEDELGIREGLHADKKLAMRAASENHRRMYDETYERTVRQEYTKSVYRRNDGKRFCVLLPKRKKLTATSLTTQTRNDLEE